MDLRDIDAFMFDLDGVLYHVTTPIPGAAQFISALQEEGVPFLLVTNNSSLTTDQYVEKLQLMGISVSADHILTSAVATGDYVIQYTSPDARIYVIGEDGIRATMEETGRRLTDQDPEYVVVGFDRHIDYAKLTTASLAIRAGATFIATNDDVTLPSPRGLLPGNGAILAAIIAATGVSPIVIGKPQRALYDAALERLGSDPNRTAMVGDRIETDIVGAKQLGLPTVLVLSGATSPEDIGGLDSPADMIFTDIKAVYEAWKEARVALPSKG